MFLVQGVEPVTGKPMQFRILSKDSSKPEILLQAPSASLRDEWVKIVTLLLDQRKARTAVDDVVAIENQPQSAAAPATAGTAYDKDEDEEEEQQGVVTRSTTTVVTESDSLSKEAHEKFAQQMRRLVLNRDVVGMRSIMDPPPKDVLIYFYQKELSRTVLHFAAYEGDLKMAQLLGTLDTRLLDLSDHIGWTPLHVAAYRGGTEMCELLLKLGANSSCSDNNGRSPLYVALSAGHPEVCRALLSKQAAGPGWGELHVAAISGGQSHLERFSKTELGAVHQATGLTALHLAASVGITGSAEAVLYLIEEGEMDVNQSDSQGRTALFYAAASGAMQPLRVLLGKGATVKHVDQSKRMALHAAAGGGHSDVCEHLLEKGSPHSPEDEHGWTPLHLAAYHNSPDSVKALLAKQARLEARGLRASTPLMLCLADDSVQCAELLLQAGADPNSINRDGRTSLFSAVLNQSLQIVKALITHEVTVNRKDDEHEVAIHEALDWPEGFRYLVKEGGADPNIDLPGDDGTSLMYEMAKRGQLETVKVLRSQGALLETCSTEKQETALMAAAAENHLDVVQFLLEEGIGVNTRNSAGKTALHYACGSNASGAIVEALLAAGADRKRADGAGNLPLHIACLNGFEKCLVALGLDGEAGREATNGAKKTPLMLAAEKGSYACVSLLLEGCPDAVVTAVDDSGRTALHYALKASDVDSATSLIWAGSSASTEDSEKVRPVHLAARMGKKKLLVEMVEKEPSLDPSWVDKSERSAVHYASAGGSLDALQIMLNLAPAESLIALINAPDSHGTTSLHFACEFNYAELVELLLERGANPAIKNLAGLYPLHTASKKGKDSLLVLLQHEPRIEIDTPDAEGLTPLLIAALHGNVLAAEALIEAGAEKDLVDLDGMSVVHAAVESGAHQLVRYLGGKGADMRKADVGGSEPLHLAASNGAAECLAALLEMETERVDPNALDAEGRTALFLAATAGNVKCAKLLCQDARVDVNRPNGIGQTPLHVASMNGKLGVVREALLKREDLDEAACDGQGRTALHNVVLHDSVELTRRFLQSVPVGAVTRQQVTPLHEACVRGSLRAAKILLDNGANPDATALQGLTPMHNAASFAQNDVIELLFKAGGKLDAESERRLTPLHCAAAMGHSRTLVLLVKLGADVEALDSLGESALHKAASSGSGSSVTVLIERGADVNLESKAGESPYAKARRKGHNRVCDVLRDNA